MVTKGTAGRPRRIFTASLAAAGIVLSFLSPGLASLKKPEEFKNGIKAQDREDWRGSVALLRQSLEKLPEDGGLVRIYGTKYKSYLPHYYLGLALYKQKDCAAALKEWEESLGVGAILKTEEHREFLDYYSKCEEQVR
jgi:hypothetical protein